MVLSRASCALLLVAGSLAGCGESLFDANGKRRDAGTDDGGGDGGGGDGDVPTTCPDVCLGDAGKDFKDPTKPWSYFDEVPITYLWQPMAIDGVGVAGTLNPGNKFRKCADSPGASACGGDMSGAILVTTDESMPGTFPALQFKPTGPDVLRLIIRVRVPSDSKEHTLWFYRNSREDLLFKQRVAPGDGDAETEIIVDGIMDDRFLVAFEPTGVGGTAAVQFFVSDMDDAPRCQLGASFSTSANNSIEDLCASTRDLTSKMTGGAAVAPTLVDNQAPYGELGKVLQIQTDRYLDGPVSQLLRRNGGPLTIQFWVRLLSPPATGVIATAFSDLSVDDATGLHLGFYSNVMNNPFIQIEGALDVAGTTIHSRNAAFVLDEWRFVRIVDSVNQITVCVSGVPTLTLPVKPTRGEAMYPPYLGKVTDSSNDPPRFQGYIDDLRVVAGALPCN